MSYLGSVRQRQGRAVSARSEPGGQGADDGRTTSRNSDGRHRAGDPEHQKLELCAQQDDIVKMSRMGNGEAGNGRQRVRRRDTDDHTTVDGTEGHHVPRLGHNAGEY